MMGTYPCKMLRLYSTFDAGVHSAMSWVHEVTVFHNVLIYLCR